MIGRILWGVTAVAVVAVVMSAVLTKRASAFPLVKNGITKHTIVLSTGASPSEKHAAAELQKFIKEMSGATLPIVDESAAPKAKLVVIGRGALQEKIAPGIPFDKLGDEGFVIRNAGGNLVIAGGKLRGTMYGVYYLLDDVLGCRWYSSYASKIPKMKTIRLDQPGFESKPDFEYREPFYSDAFDADWAARNRTNGNAAKLDEARGGKIGYNRFCHTFDELVPMPTYYKDHPEYYSLIGDKRVGGQYDGQLCLTNPEVLKIVTTNVLSWIAAAPQLKIVSVSQNDNYGYCKCPNCAAVDAEEGSPAGLMLRFVNAVADEVAKQYPDILLDTFAYQYTEKTPKITKPRPNVRVRLCPIDCCEHHPYETCPNNANFMANLNNWSALTDNMYIWHYNTNFANYLLPMPDFDQLPQSIRLYKTSGGVKGVFCQGTYTAGYSPAGGGGWMDNLKAYMQAKLLWNTGADAAAVRRDFMQGFFGNAWKPVDETIDIIQEKVRKDNIHGGIFQRIEGVLFLPDDLIARCSAKFDEAEKLAESPEVLARVKHARLSIRYVQVCRQGMAAKTGTPEQRLAATEAFKQFADEAAKGGITNISEGGTLTDWLNGKVNWLK